MKLNFLAAAITIGFVASANSANATLIGDDVTIDWLFPNTSTVFATETVAVGAGIEVTCPGGFSGGGLCAGFAGPSTIDIGSETIRYEEVNSPGFNAADFNGFVFSDLDWIGMAGKIVGVSIVNNIAGLDLSRVSFTADSVSINFAGLGGGNQTDFAELTLDVIHAVPEPGTLALFGLGLAGLGFAALRRKAS